MRRRELLLGAAALAAAPGLRAQARKVLRIGWPSAIPREAATSFLVAFEKGLREHGYVLGQDAVIEFRYAGLKPENIAAATRELIGNVDVIVTGTNPVTAAAKSVTRTIPIVFAVGINVVGQGFVKTLAAPGGNLTGLTWNVGDLSHNKALELLKAAVPRISRVAVLYDPGQDAGHRGPLQEAAKMLGVNLQWFELSGDFERSFESIVRGRADAVYAISAAQQYGRRDEIIEQLRKNRLAATFGISEFVDAGALMAYGVNFPALFRRAAVFVDKILKGARPADIPVEQPTQFEMILNLKTAKTLGIKIPNSILVQATKVIE